MSQPRWWRGRHLAALMALGLVLMALGGCMRVERGLTIQADGTGSYVLTVAVRYPTAGDPASLPTKNVAGLDAFGARVKRQGGDYRRYDEQGYAYWAYTRPFTSVTQANAFLQEDPRQDDPTHFLVLYHDTLHVAAQPGVLGPPTYRVTGTLSLADLTGNAKQQWQDATERLTITMPGGLVAHEGGAVSGNSVTYAVGYNQTTTVDVTGRSSQPGGQVSGGLIAGVAALAFVLGALGVWLLLRARRIGTALRTA